LRSSVGLRQEQPEAVKLHWCQDALEQPVVVVDGDHLTARHVTELGPIDQENRRRKLWQERFGEIELHIEALEAREHQ
jgi:hypothetical protein